MHDDDEILSEEEARRLIKSGARPAQESPATPRKGTPGERGKRGKDGADGRDGKPGQDGKDGKDGILATKALGDLKADEEVKMLQVEVVVVKGKDGKDGKDGRNGKDGKDGKGEKGSAGKDGKDGKDGRNGERGDDGRGVPKGGRRNQVLAKNSDEDFDTYWKEEIGGEGGGAGPLRGIVLSVMGLNTDNSDPARPIIRISTDSTITGSGTPDDPLSTTGVGGAVWGAIVGTLSDQTDLQAALDAKYDASNPAGYVDAAGASAAAPVQPGDLAPYALISSLAAVAFSGDYTDLINLPDLGDYITADGATPLTGNWDAGAFDIEAQSFTIGANTLTTSEWANLDGLNQKVHTTAAPTFQTLILAAATNQLTLDTSTNAVTFNSGSSGSAKTLTTPNITATLAHIGNASQTFAGSMTFSQGFISSAKSTFSSAAYSITSGLGGTMSVLAGTSIGAYTVTFPSVTSTLAILGANTFTGAQTISAQNIITDTTTGSKIGTGTTQKLGFWNATPVVQPAQTGTTTAGFAANASANAVFAESTFTGNTGATAYTVSDIVRNLKTAGLLAA